jgi:hypothetical protein
MASSENACPHCHEAFDTPESLLQHLIDSPDCRPPQTEGGPPGPVPEPPAAPAPAEEPAPPPQAVLAKAPPSDEEAASLISKWSEARDPAAGACSGSLAPEARCASGNVEYDPDVIQAFANALYRQAAAIIAGATLLCLLGGFAAGAFFGSGSTKGAWVFAGALFGGLIGFFAGRAKAFALKLLAQTALCQMHIEKNTRKGRAESL